MSVQKIFSLALALLLILVSVPAYAEDSPTLYSQPDAELVLDLLEAYAPDAYYTMKYTAGGGSDMLMWWKQGQTLLDGLGTAVHEQYHTFQSAAAQTVNSRAYYIGDGIIQQVPNTDVFPSDEIAALIPEECQTARFVYVSAQTPDMEDVISVQAFAMVDGKLVSIGTDGMDGMMIPGMPEGTALSGGTLLTAGEGNPIELNGSDSPPGLGNIPESAGTPGQQMSVQELLAFMQNPDNKPFSITDGVYGLLAEYGAYAHENKMSVSLYDFYKTLDQTPDTWAQYVQGISGTYGSSTEFEYYILLYLIYAQKVHPEIYKGIMLNDAFLSVFAAIYHSFQASEQAYINSIDQIAESMSALGYNVSTEDGRLSMGETSVVYAASEGIFAIAQELQKPEYQAMLARLLP